MHDSEWSTWSKYRRDAIEVLGLATAGVTGHENCFHRRGKALTPLMYRVALLLRTDGGTNFVPSDNAMLTVAGGVEDSYGFETSPIVDVIREADGEVPAGPPRYLGVRSPTDRWIALRTDGWVATAAGTIDAAELWRAGANEQEIAGAIQEQVQA